MECVVGTMEEEVCHGDWGGGVAGRTGGGRGMGHEVGVGKGGVADEESCSYYVLVSVWEEWEG